MHQLHNSVSVAYMGKARMEMEKLNPISKDNLKVGDVVGIAREVRSGYGAGFRHVMVYPAKIIRITPKRTKIETDKFGEQLEKRSTLAKPVGWTKSYEIVILNDAVEIVKGGGVE